MNAQSLRRMISALLALGLAAGLLQEVRATSAWPELVSHRTDQSASARVSTYAATDATGNRVVYSSEEDTAQLVSGKTGYTTPQYDQFWNVYLHDRPSNQTYLISHDTAGNAANQYSVWGIVSRDGNYAVFQSSATNIDYENSLSGLAPQSLPAPLPNNYFQVYLADLRNPGTGIPLLRLSQTAVGAAGNNHSGNASTDSGTWVRENPISGFDFARPYPPAAVYYNPQRNLQVVFQSRAGNLTADSTGGGQDLFVWTQTGLTTGDLKLLTKPAYGLPAAGYFRSPSVSLDGRYLAFVVSSGPDETDGQVYLMDRDTDNDNVLDNSTPTYTLVSRGPTGMTGNGLSESPSISGDGVFVAFASDANNLQFSAVDQNSVSDIFLFSRRSGLSTLISVNAQGKAGDDGSYAPGISWDGQAVTFHSYAADLWTGTPDDTATCDYDFGGQLVTLNCPDVFVWYNGGLSLLSKNQDGHIGNKDSFFASITYNRSFALFTSRATNMPADASNAPALGNVYITTTNIPAIDINTQAMISESPGRWDVGLLRKGDTDQRKKTFQIRNLGKQNLTVTRVYTDEVNENNQPYLSLVGTTYPYCQLDTSQVLAEEEYCTFEVTLTSNVTETGYAVYTFVIESNDPRTPSIRVPITVGLKPSVFLPVVRR